jgi:hypothetical protein
MILGVKDQFLPKCLPDENGQPIAKPFSIRQGKRWSTKYEAQICTGVRTKNFKEHCRYKVLEVLTIDIDIAREQVWITTPKGYTLVRYRLIKEFTTLDGFDSEKAFFKFFANQLKYSATLFSGQIIIFGQAGLDFIEQAIQADHYSD